MEDSDQTCAIHLLGLKTSEVPLKDELIQGESDQDLITKLQESLIIRRYIDADLSIGGVAEHLNLRVLEDASSPESVGRFERN